MRSKKFTSTQFVKIQGLANKSALGVIIVLYVSYTEMDDMDMKNCVFMMTT